MNTYTCRGCGKVVLSEAEDVPNGWFGMMVTYGLSNTQAEEEWGAVCSPTCAKRWLSAWHGE